MPCNFPYIGYTQPQTKNKPYIGLRGSKPGSKGTRSTHSPPPPLFLVSTLRKRPNGRLDHQTGAHERAASYVSNPNKWVPELVNWFHREEKKDAFQKLAHTMWAAKTNSFTPFCRRWPALALQKTQNALKMRQIATKNSLNMGPKCTCPKIIWGAQTSEASPFRARKI